MPSLTDDPRLAVRVADKGVPLGVATLGGDGVVPPSQLPAVIGGPFVTSVNGHTGVVTLGYADVGAVSASDPRLGDARAPTGPAGGMLAGTYPSPSIAAGVITATHVAAANIDGTSATPSLRTLGPGPLQAVAGNDFRLKDVLRVEEYPRLSGETDDTGRLNRAAPDAVAQGRPLAWQTNLTVDGWSIPSGLMAVGPGKLTVVGTQPFPLYGPPGTHDVYLRGFELDGNKAAIAGDPDVTANPTCLIQFDGTAANPCRRIYVDLPYMHDSKRLGVIFANVQEGGIRGRSAHNERDGATLYYNTTDVQLDIVVSDCGDDYLGINSGEGSTVGLCQRITGRLRATGPSARAKGRALTIRGGNNIHLDVHATNVSQSGVWLSTWPGAPLTNVVLNGLQIVGAGTGGGAVDKDGVHIEVSDSDYIRGVHLNGGFVKGSLGWGIKFVNLKAAPADGDISGVYINGLPVSDSVGSGIGASGAHAVDHVWVTDSPVKGSGGDGIVFDGAMTEVHVIDSPAYANTGWGHKMRVIVGGSLRGSPASGNGNGINIALLSGQFDYNNSPAWGNTGVNVQDDGGHVATWVAAGRPDGPAAGDLGGTYPNPTVAKLGQNSTRYGQGADLNSFAAEYAHVRSNYVGVTDRLMNSTKPSWTMVLDGRAGVDRFAVVRAPATAGAPVDADMLSLSSAGVLNVAGYQQGGAGLASTHLSDSAQLARLASPTFTGTVTIPTLAVTTLSGTPNFSGAATGQTAAVDDSSTKLATTAYVLGQLSATGDGTPAMDSTAARGTSLHGARADHVHPTDTSRAALASPTFTGTPAAPTAAVDTNTTQLATTAYVVGQAGGATPLVDGAGAAGTSLRYARQDHVHPTDTSRAPTASPTFTGTAVAATLRANTVQAQTGTANEIALWSDGHIYFGLAGHTNLYSSATDTLKTDDSLHVGTDFRHLGANLGFFGHAAAARAAAYTLNSGTLSRNLAASGNTADGVANALRQVITDLIAYGLLQ